MPTLTAATLSRKRQLGAEGQHGVQGIDQGDQRPRDAQGARAAVGLQHVAIERDGSLAEGVQVGHGAEAAAHAVAGFRWCGRRFSRPDRVLCAELVLPGNMAYSAVIQPRCWSAIHGGTCAATLAVQSTVVRPAWTSTLPGDGPGEMPLDPERAKSSAWRPS